MITWHLLQYIPENAAQYVSCLIKSTKPDDFKKNYLFPTPEDPGEPQHHTPSQKRILSELRTLQELPQDEITRIEDLLVEYHDVFARHRFNIGMNDKFKVN